MNVLALEPWYGGSHRNFLDGLVRHSRYEIRRITMPARFWKWRMHGGAVTIARKALQEVHAGFAPDVLFASSMVNVPAFLALTRRHLGRIPVVYYLHENQLTYPISDKETRDLAYAYINYLSCLAADRIVFNSAFHYEEFMRALPGLLKVFPDYTNLSTVQEIREKSSVLHLGMDLKAHDAFLEPDHAFSLNPAAPAIVLWNQRWEYDKNPAAFFRLMSRLDDSGHRFRLILAGKHFEEQPNEFEQAFERYAERILHYGYAEDFEEYSRLLHRADIVVSTAIHEFFGIAVMEAVYCGCHPVLPDRLSYPELIPDSHHRPLLHAPVLYKDYDELYGIMSDLLAGRERPLPPVVLRSMLARLDWTTHVDRYDELLGALMHENPST